MSIYRPPTISRRAQTGPVTVASQPATMSPPASFSIYLAARPYSPPSARVKTLAESPAKSVEHEAARIRLLDHSRLIRAHNASDNNNNDSTDYTSTNAAAFQQQQQQHSGSFSSFPGSNSLTLSQQLQQHSSYSDTTTTTTTAGAMVDSSSSSSSSLQQQQHHYSASFAPNPDPTASGGRGADKWSKSWTSDVVALNVGLRRPAVLPVPPRTQEVLAVETERRLAEADRQVLLNRVRALQGQERRAATKIHAAAEKLDRVRTVRAQQRVRKGARDELIAELAAQRYDEAQAKRDDARRARAAVEEYKAAVAAQRQHQRAQLQAERREGEMLQRQVRDADEAARRAAASVVRAQGRLHQQRREAAAALRQAAAEGERARRLQHAAEARDAALRDMDALQRAEQEMLARLQARGAQHSAVFEQLAGELEPSAAAAQSHSQSHSSSSQAYSPSQSNAQSNALGQGQGQGYHGRVR